MKHFLEKILFLAIFYGFYILSLGCNKHELFGVNTLTDSIVVEVFTTYSGGVWGGDIYEYRLNKIGFKSIEIFTIDGDHENVRCFISNDTLYAYKFDQYFEAKLDSTFLVLSDLEPL